MEQIMRRQTTSIRQTDRFSLTPAGGAALAACRAEAALTPSSDVYEVTLALDAVLDAFPEDHAALRRFTRRFPQFNEELIATGYARFAFGLTLTDAV